MGILTWQNVPVGDLSAGQEGFRTASMLLDRATNAGQEGIAAYQSILDSKKAFEQQMADRAVVAKMMSIQDPEEYKKALAAGLVDPSIAQAASLGSLMQANKQVDVLQGRAQADQQLLNTKQSFDALAYKMGREQEGDRLSDAAMPVFNEALKVAVSDRTKALKMIENSNVQLEDKLKMVASIDGQYQDKSQQWRLAMEQRQFDMAANAARLRQIMMKEASGDVGAQGDILNAFANNTNNPALAEFKNMDPRVRALVAESVRSGLSREDPEFYKGAGSLNATMGDAPVEPIANPNKSAINTFNAILPEFAENLSAGAKIYERAQPFAMATAADMADEIGKTNPNFNKAEFTKVIRETRAKLPADVEISEGALAHMIVNSMQESSFYNWDNFLKGGDLVKGDLDKLISTISTSKHEIEDFNRMKERQTEIATLSQKRDELSQKYADAQRRLSHGMGQKSTVDRYAKQIEDTDEKIANKFTTVEKAAHRHALRKAKNLEIAKQAKEASLKAEQQAEEERKKRSVLGLLNADEMRKRREMAKKTGSMF